MEKLRRGWSNVRGFTRAHWLLSGIAAAAVFAATSVGSSLIDRGVGSFLPDGAEEALEQQKALIEARTKKIDASVAGLKQQLDVMGTKIDKQDLERFRQEAEDVVKELQAVSPIVLTAATQNSAIVASLRRHDLAETGASLSSALLVPDNSSATVCKDFTVGVNSNGSRSAIVTLSRRGKAEGSTLISGETVALEQPDASASVSLAGVRSDDPRVYGIDFNCYAGKGGPD